jgi:hypothetical protein
MSSNPKPEARNPKQIQSTKTKAQNGDVAPSRFGHFFLWSFGFVSDFGFRASDFLFNPGFRSGSGPGVTVPFPPLLPRGPHV